MGETTQEEGWVVCRIFKKKNHLKTLDSPPGRNESRGSYFFDSCNDGALEQILEQMGRSCEEEIKIHVKLGRSSLRPIDTGLSNGYLQERFFKLPSLESPNSTTSQICYQPMIQEVTPENEVSFGNHHPMGGDSHSAADENLVYPVDSSGSSAGLANWAALDRLVASQLNGCPTDSSRQLACFHESAMAAAYCSTAEDRDPEHLKLPMLKSSSSPPSHKAHYPHPAMDYNSDIDLWSFARSSSSSLPNVENGCPSE